MTMDTLNAIPIEECSFMKGCKKAVKANGKIYLSPAMMDLVKHADEDELQHLLANIPLLDFGDFDPLKDPQKSLVDKIWWGK